MNGREYLTMEAAQNRIRELEAENAATWKALRALNRIVLEITDTLIRDGSFPNAVPTIIEERAAALAPLGLK
jgi:hypothetical protein